MYPAKQKDRVKTVIGKRERCYVTLYKKICCPYSLVIAECTMERDISTPTPREMDSLESSKLSPHPQHISATTPSLAWAAASFNALSK